MIARLTTTFACLLIFTSGLFAQKPENIRAETGVAASALEQLMCTAQNAGTINSIMGVGAQSNDIGQNVSFLCLGDQFSIDHNNDFDLTDDPSPSTPGIGYAFMDCEPTQTGIALSDILRDPCINNKSPIILNGMLTFQTDGIWLAADQNNGDATFTHDGELLTSFTGGRAAKQFWFAPITIDNFDTRGYYQDPSSGELGPCVNMRADQAFSIVYLAPIETTNPTISEVAGNCTGTFEVRGGFAEFERTENYTITIENTSTASVGTITSGAASHGNTVEFTVPEFGTYEITVEDGKSCGSTFRMDFFRCNGIESFSSSDIVQPGNTVCVDVVVNDFVDIAGLQYTLQWDPTVLELVSINEVIPGFDEINWGDAFRANGQMTISWTAPNIVTGITFPPGQILYNVCFRAIGQVGDFSEILLNSSQTTIEVSNKDQVKIGFDNSTVGRISITNQAIDLQFGIDTACHSITDGALEIFPIGGTPPYEITYRNLTVVPAGTIQGPFFVNTVNGSTKPENLGAATYEVTVTDNSMPQETFTTTVDVVERDQLTVAINELQGVTCAGEMDGVLIANLTLDGNPVVSPGNEYQYVWNTADETRVISNLGAQTYSVAVTDVFGCVSSDTEPLMATSPISIIGTTTTASCSGVDDGGVTFDVQGGTPAPGNNYDITMTGPSMVPITSTGNRLNITGGIIAGRYDISITDDNGCSLDTFLIVNALKTLSLDTRIIDNVTCDGDSDGTIFVAGVTTGASAALPYNFTWIASPPIPPGNITNAAETSNVEMLSVGNYNVVMLDQDGCRLDTTFMITAPDAISVTLFAKTPESCVGMDGTAEVRVTGGTPIGGYNFDWGVAGQTTNIATGLTAGNYIVTVTDNSMCEGTLAFTIDGSTPPIITAFENDTLDCFNSIGGMLSVTAIDGSDPITGYSWRNSAGPLVGETGTSISNRPPGIYYVIVNAGGCEVIDSAFIVAPDELMITGVDVNRPLCPFDQNGAAVVNITGGNEPYDIRWSPNPSSPSPPFLTNLSAGSYTVTVIDAKSPDCPSVSRMFTVEDPPQIVINAINPSNISCPGSTCDGGITVLATYDDGSSGSFNFTWSSGETENGVASSTATMFCQENESVAISDGTCPAQVFPLFIPANEAVTAMITEAESVSCFGLADGSAIVEGLGGEAPFTYNWLNAMPNPGNPAQAINLSADTFFVDITDRNGCPFSTNVIITEPTEFIAEVIPFNPPSRVNTFDVSCAGLDDGQITVTTFGGNPGNLSYDWDPVVAPSSSPIASGLTAGTYSVTVTDARGCESSTMHSIAEPSPIIFSLDSIRPIQCFGFTTVIDSIANVSGGNGGRYSYSVDGGPRQAVEFTTNLFAGPHDISIFDTNNCRTDTTIVITQPNPVSISIDPVIEVELGDSLQLRPQYNPGGVPINPDSIFWEPADFLSCDRCPDPITRPLEDRFYTITAFDINGCPGFAEVLIEVDKNRNVFLPNAFSPNGDGVNDEFRVFTGVGVQKVNYVRIFDRWGTILYDQKDIEPNVSGITTWDGFFQGKPLDPGVFVYLVEVEFEDGLTLLYRGDLTLLR